MTNLSPNCDVHGGLLVLVGWIVDEDDLTVLMMK